MTAREGAGPDAADALEKLCGTYWYPLYAFVRRQGNTPEDAQDLTQGFFAHLLARDFLKGLSRDHGRFRAFLLASLRHFISDQWDKRRALKRGGGQPILSFDSASAENRYQLEPLDPATPEQVYERRWALTLLDQALIRLRDEFVAAGRSELFEILREFQGDEPASATASEVAARFGWPVNTFKSHLHRFRRRYRELLCEEVAQTVATPLEVEEEIRHLKAALGGQL